MNSAEVVADMRRRLVAEADDHNRKCLLYSTAWMIDDSTSQADCDAYTGLSWAGTYALTLATILRDVAERDPEFAEELAVTVGMAATHGMDFLNGANDDLFADSAPHSA